MSVIHDSDCSVHNEPALSAAPCDCSAWPKEYHRLHMAALKAYAAPEGEENYAAFAAADDALWAFVKHNFKAARGVGVPATSLRPDLLQALQTWATDENWPAAYSPHAMRDILAAVVKSLAAGVGGPDGGQRHG